MGWVGRSGGMFEADLLGLKEELKVEVEDDQRRVEEEHKNGTWHQTRCSSGKLLRRFRLPGNAGMVQVMASTKNGVLPVTIPKFEEKTF
ncbi:hypothetical protein CDL15_Pgr011022 [Punica granatum]|uniref:SHSP domain-containing protein n=1 Tax=Punica granatum TaxID=22663 RepID=A0A218XN42_PUNGR|nr:hypothetical protein CDL15_Pgr011022 [Punica granatum]